MNIRSDTISQLQLTAKENAAFNFTNLVEVINLNEVIWPNKPFNSIVKFKVMVVRSKIP